MFTNKNVRSTQREKTTHLCLCTGAGQTLFGVGFRVWIRSRHRFLRASQIVNHSTRHREGAAVNYYFEWRVTSMVSRHYLCDSVCCLIIRKPICWKDHARWNRRGGILVYVARYIHCQERTVIIRVRKGGGTSDQKNPTVIQLLVFFILLRNFNFLQQWKRTKQQMK